MRCKICGLQTKETFGVHYVNGKWLLMKADYCYKHGSFVSKDAFECAHEVTPDHTKREHIRPGLHVLVVLKENQPLQTPTEGYVKSILTNAFIHPRGIKVMLMDGRIGRVCKILQ